MASNVEEIQFKINVIETLEQQTVKNDQSGKTGTKRHGNTICELEEDKLKSAVCFLWQCFNEDDNAYIQYGSGFYASFNTKNGIVKGIVTCHHVIKNEDQAKNTYVEFFHDGKSKRETIKLRPDKYFVTGDEDLDYTIVGCDEDHVENTLKISPIRYDPNVQFDTNDAVVIYQHPDGRPREKSTQKITKIWDGFITYFADTEGGSSGSPVFHNWNLIAIHYQGDNDGNDGVLMKTILSYLEKNGKPMAQRKRRRPENQHTLDPEQSSDDITFDQIVYVLGKQPEKDCDHIENVAVATNTDQNLGVVNPVVTRSNQDNIVFSEQSCTATDTDQNVSKKDEESSFSKMIAFKMHEKLGGTFKIDRFCRKLFKNVDNNERIINELLGSKYPVLDAICEYCEKEDEHDLIEVVNDALKEIDCRGLQLRKEDVSKAPFDSHGHKLKQVELTEKSINDIFAKISEDACYDERFIALFLIPYNCYKEIREKNHSPTIRLQEVLKCWTQKTRNCSWKILGSVLLFLSCKKLVRTIQG